jgi:hypothetical protein
VRAEIEQEIEDILKEVRKATGTGGRGRKLGSTAPDSGGSRRRSSRPSTRRRKLGSTASDRAWGALTRNLCRVYPRLRDAGMPGLADHLYKAIRVECPHITYCPPLGTPPWSIKG